jgi:opacity protein-like surface antigen
MDRCRSVAQQEAANSLWTSGFGRDIKRDLDFGERSHPEQLMLRSLSLVALSCLPVLGCAVVAPDAPDTLIAPRALTVPSAPDGRGWTTESFGRGEPVASAAPDYDADDIIRDLDDRHFTVLIGERQLDDDEWDPVEDQLAAGIEFNASDSDSGHGFEIGTTYSQNDDDVGFVDVDGNVFEVYGGYRYTFGLDRDHSDPDLGRVHPYLGAGGAVLRGEVEVDTPGGNDSDDDISPGAYIRAGVGFDLTEELRIGVDYRHLFLSDMDIGPIDDADFDMFTLTLGFKF